MKRWLSLTAASVMLMCFVTGCGKNDGDVNSKGTTESSKVTEEVTSATEKATENNRNDNTDNGVVGDIVTDAGDMVEDIVTDAGDIVDDIIPGDSENTTTETTR